MLKEQFQLQIWQEAEGGANQPQDTVSGLMYNSGYKTGYCVAGEHYAALWQAAEEKAARYEKALKLIEQMSDPGDYWLAVTRMKSIATDALTPKTSEGGR